MDDSAPRCFSICSTSAAMPDVTSEGWTHKADVRLNEMKPVDLVQPPQQTKQKEAEAEEERKKTRSHPTSRY